MSSLRARLLLVALLTAALLGAGAWAARGTLRLDSSTDVLLAGDARSSDSYQQIGRLMGDRLPLAIFADHPALFSDAGRDALARLCNALHAVPDVADVKSLTHSAVPVRKAGFALDPRDLIGTEAFLPQGRFTEAEWAERRARVLADPLARDVFVSGDGGTALVIVTAEGLTEGPSAEAFADAVIEVVDAHAGSFTDVEVGGIPILEREISTAVRTDSRRMLVAAGVLVAVVLLLAFRSLWAVAFLLILGGAGLCGVPILLSAAGTGLNIYTSLLLPLVAGLQLNFLAHFVAALLDGERSGRDGAGALRAALHHVTPPSVLAAATTALGMLALRASDVGLVKQFGTVGAGAVVIALMVSLAPGWLLSLMLGAGQPWQRARGASVRAGAWVAWLGTHRRSVIGAGLVLALFAGWGATRLQTDLRAQEFLNPDSSARLVLERSDRDFGGMNSLQLQVDTGAPDGVTSRPVLEFLRAMRREAETLPEVSHVYELSLVFERMQSLWDGDDAPDGPRLPGSDMQLSLYTTLLRAANIPLLDVLVDKQSRVTNVVVRGRDMPSARWLSVLDHLQAWAEARLPEGTTLSVQAGMHELLAADARMVAAQRDSLGVAALAVTLLLALVLRSPRLALLAVATNLLPLLVVFGVMGAAGVPLNSITVMVGALALGVAVDDAIHLLLWMRRESGTPRERLTAALAAKARPVMTTSAVMTVVFALFLLSWFPPVETFGALGAVAMACALGATLVVLPALLLRRIPE
ncbi:MAG: efflux RND transporter permease subunit [Planctomycetota bacterium]|jgi:predicted RND superfamily exporter protein